MNRAAIASCLAALSLFSPAAAAPTSGPDSGADGAAKIIQSAFREIRRSGSMHAHGPQSSRRGLARACASIPTLTLEKTYEDDTGVPWSCTCGGVPGQGLSSNGVINCVSLAAYCISEREEHCVNTELNAYFSDDYSWMWLVGTVVAEMLYSELSLKYVAGPRAGSTLTVTAEDYSCTNADDNDTYCSCEAVFDGTKCASCNWCSAQGRKGHNYDCTAIQSGVFSDCRDSDWDRYPFTESALASTSKPTTRQPTPMPVTKSPTNKPTEQPKSPNTGSTSTPNLRPATSAPSPSPTSAPNKMAGGSTNPDPPLSETVPSTEQKTFIGPGLVECAGDARDCTFLESLAEECNLVALIPIASITTAEDTQSPVVVASGINTAASPLPIREGCEITCSSDCTFVASSNEPQPQQGSGDAGQGQSIKGTTSEDAILSKAASASVMMVPSASVLTLLHALTVCVYAAWSA